MRSSTRAFGKEQRQAAAGVPLRRERDLDPLSLRCPTRCPSHPWRCRSSSWRLAWAASAPRSLQGYALTLRSRALFVVGMLPPALLVGFPISLSNVAAFLECSQTISV